MAAASTIKYLKLPSLIFSILLLIHGASGAVSIAASDTLNNGGNITDGETTLVSAGGSFTLGFFSPNRVPIKRYLGIWFTVSPDAVYWVANRDAPLNNTSGVLVISPGGILRLLDGGAGQTAWASNTTGAVSSSSVVAQLLESGNLVVLEKSSGAILWQSFDHPSNTLLSGMKLGKSPKTGAEWSLTSWRSQDDPATGSYRRVMDTKGLPDIVTWQGNVKKYRSGPWNGRWFSGVPDIASDFKLFSVQMLGNYDEVTYVLNATAGSTFTRFVLDEAGKVDVLVWIPTTRAWRSFAWSPRDGCDDYAACGAFGLCSDAAAASAPSCSCVEGFSPVNQSEFSGGCQRDVQLECRNGRTTDEFTVVRGVKLPDTDNTTVAERVTLEQCRAMCLVDCSCVAYAPAYIRGGGGVGSGCVMWMDNIVDVRYIDNGQDLYVRLAKAELDRKKRTDASPWRGPKPELFHYLRKRKKRNMVIILLPVTACLLALAGMFLVWMWCKLRGKRRKKDFQKKMMLGYFDAPNTLDDENIDLPFFSFGDIVSATNTFAEDNMLGKGGFGKVYKGMLGDKNKEVAIKRLSQGSGQGIDEFRNEVVLIARLQHRNLVRLLGYCIHENEKLLIYEYLPNKSLDFFIFDAASKKVLDWPTRFRIIKGISRGLLYLHQDSRLTVVHRDLKPSNILLDADMNPKISDFGMARIFGGNQQEANTNRVVGTYGYMSPEYAMDGAFSVRSDVYSFGVILLEIISGMRISTTHFTDFANLLAYAWSLWKDGKAIDLVDTSLLETCSTTEALRCIHIGLLCVQDNPNSRPLMSSVVLMLENEATPLSVPKQPLYFSQWYLEAQETGENSNKSTNKISVTVLQGR